MKNKFSGLLRRACGYAVLSVLMILPNSLKAQCMSDDFSNAGLWTAGAGANPPIVNGASGAVSKFTSVQGGVMNYIYRPIGFTLNSTDRWTAEIEFTPTATGSNCPASTLVSLTAGTVNSWNSSIVGFPQSNQDAVEAYYNTNYCNGSTDWRIYGRGKKGTTWGTASTPGIVIDPNANPGVTYYIRLQRISAGEAMISVFSNSSFTTHVTGSPVCFDIDPTITGLTHVQQGCIPQGSGFRTLTATFDNLNICNSTLCDDYSSATPWTQTSTGISVTGGVAQFTTCAAGSDRRVSRSIGAMIATSTNWTAETEFNPTAISAIGAAHAVLAFTAGAGNIWPSTPISQDVVMAYIAGNSGARNIYAAGGDGGAGWGTGSAGIPLPSLNTTYYIRLERCGTSGLVSVFSDAAHLNHITGSPQSFYIPPGVQGLNTLSHGSLQSTWSSSRTLSGTVDNTCIYNMREEAGDIGSDQYICQGATPALLTSTSSGSGCAIYQWEREVPCGSSNWQSIVGATQATYQPPSSPTVTICYRRRQVGLYCSDLLSDTVMVEVSDLQATAGPDITLCCGTPTYIGYAGGSATGGVPGYTYLWAPAGYVSCTTCASPMITNCTSNWPIGTTMTFTLTVTDAAGCVSTDQVVVTRTCRMANPDLLLNNSVTFPEELTIAPNPADGNFTIQFPSASAVRDIEIINMLGEIVYSTNSITAPSLVIDISQQPKGIYFVRCRENGFIYNKRVVIQ